MRDAHPAWPLLILVAALASWVVVIVLVRVVLSLPVDALLWVAMGLVVFAVVRRVAPVAGRGRG